MDFSEKIYTWLTSALAQEVPKSVVAFSFNLFELETADAKYGIELVGADEFDPANPDWACGEEWVASPRSISIPNVFANGDWDDCLRDVKRLLSKILGEFSAPATKLKEAKAVAIGFVDGDLELIWQR